MVRTARGNRRGADAPAARAGDACAATATSSSTAAPSTSTATATATGRAADRQRTAALHTAPAQGGADRQSHRQRHGEARRGQVGLPDLSAALRLSGAKALQAFGT
ncbi:hypothetical protein [Sphingomonas sp. LT1P40]|uniref:hypothetical protein n=1 Tax=Alteristakelama amylovorans TaxID=3096166 RepID=UPI002FCBCDB0